MPSASIPGRLARLEISPDAGATYQNFGGIVDVTMNMKIDELETTTHDSAGARSYIPNHHDITFDISAQWLDGDPGQEIVLTAVFAKTTFPLKFYMEVATGRKRFDGSGFATSFSPKGPLNDAGGLDISIRGSSVILVAQ